MTDPSTPPASTSTTTDAEKPDLLRQLEDLGGTLVQSELPSSSQLQHIVGGVIKVLEHAGVTVADELYPAEPEPVARPETQQAQQHKQTQSRLDRLEGMLEKFFADSSAQDTPAPAEGSSTATEAGS